MSGKCPKCEKLVGRVTIDNITAKAFLGRGEWKAVAYLCPMCQTILSVGIDPVALKTDTIEGVVAALRKG
jgi:hypothetical protein